MATSKIELLPLEGAISGIWRFFGFPAKDGQFVEKDKKRNEVACKLCFQVLKYASNTTNIHRFSVISSVTCLSVFVLCYAFSWNYISLISEK